MRSSRAFSNHRITAEFAQWVVTLLPAQRNDLASIAKVLARIIASCDAARAMTATNLGHHALGAAKVPDGIIRQQSALLVHFAAITEFRARVISAFVTTPRIATITTSGCNQVVTAKRRLNIVDISTALLVDLVGIAEVVARVVALDPAAFALFYSVLRAGVTAATKEVCWIISSLTALGNDGTLVAKVHGRVVSLLFAASRVFATGAMVEVVLAADVRYRIVGFLEALRKDIFVEAKIPVDHKQRNTFNMRVKFQFVQDVGNRRRQRGLMVRALDL